MMIDNKYNRGFLLSLDSSNLDLIFSTMIDKKYDPGHLFPLHCNHLDLVPPMRTRTHGCGLLLELYKSHLDVILLRRINLTK